MPEGWKQIEEWRRRAEEIRTVADDFSVPSATDMIRNTARSYERLADDLERRLRSATYVKPKAG